MTGNRCSFVLIALLALATVHSPAAAGEITTIKYDLSGSSATLPSFGSFPIVGTVAFAFDSVASAPVVSGNVDMVSLAFSFPFSLPGLLTGVFRASLLTPAVGAHLQTPHLVTAAASVPGSALLTGSYHCVASAAACAAAGLPASVPVVFPPTITATTIGTFPFLASNLASLSFTQSLPVTPSSVGVLTLVGSEISRTKTVPEPATLPLVLMGVIGTVGLLSYTRRRAR